MWGRLHSAIFDRCLAISQKWCKIGTQFLWDANRNLHALYQMALFSVTVTDPNNPKPLHFRHKPALYKNGWTDWARFGTWASLGLSYTVLEANLGISKNKGTHSTGSNWRYPSLLREWMQHSLYWYSTITVLMRKWHILTHRQLPKNRSHFMFSMGLLCLMFLGKWDKYNLLFTYVNHIKVKSMIHQRILAYDNSKGCRIMQSVPFGGYKIKFICCLSHTIFFILFTPIFSLTTSVLLLFIL